ncbi:unnamed protein product [Lactuca virosa]|uniref:Myb/SANT-like domain-containing protein n=1 Tax=Lactuca virosa TaxID=75947 RepID=A0AAU9NMG1_9ASTR|nr:unnamed protein product [Lactuca virosa]
MYRAFTRNLAPNKDTEEGINWTNENIVKFCEVCIDYITNNGRGQLMRWREIEDLFAEKVGKRCNFKSLKNKYDSMKRDRRLWKFLKTGETGLGWNPTTGKLDCSDECVLLVHFIRETTCKEVPSQGSLSTTRRKMGSFVWCRCGNRSGLRSSLIKSGVCDKSINDADEIQNENAWSDEAMREYS